MLAINGLRLKHITKDEYHGPCPQCGGRDRFIVWKERGNYWCRQCGLKGFLDGDARTPTVDEVAALEQRIKERQMRDALMREQAIKRLMDEAYWRGWHDAMDSAHRQYWLDEGIPDWAIDYFDLGYCPAKRINHDGATLSFPAYTIPILEPITHKPVNVQYRLMGAPPEIGKYRQELGLPAAAFFFDADKAEGEQAVIVEGSKKAIVIGTRFDDMRLQYIGLPSNSPSETLIQKINTFECAYIMLDPGAERQAQRIAHHMGKRARIVSIPVKPDDFLIRYEATTNDLRRAIKEARA